MENFKKNSECEFNDVEILRKIVGKFKKKINFGKYCGKKAKNISDLKKIEN